MTHRRPYHITKTRADKPSPVRPGFAKAYLYEAEITQRGFVTVFKATIADENPNFEITEEMAEKMFHELVRKQSLDIVEYRYSIDQPDFVI